MSEKKPCPGKETTHHVTSKGRCYPNKRASNKTGKQGKSSKSTKGRTMTYEIAMAAGKDAANEQMRRAGRTSWNQDDYNLAAETFEKLWPEEREVKEAREALLKEMQEPTLESVSRKIREAESMGKKPDLTPKEMAIRRQYGLFGMSFR